MSELGAQDAFGVVTHVPLQMLSCEDAYRAFADQLRAEKHALRDTLLAMRGNGMDDMHDHSGHTHMNNTAMDSIVPQREPVADEIGNPMKGEDFSFGLD